MTEIWRPVVGWERSYEVSDQGRVRRIAASRGTRVGRVLRASPVVQADRPKSTGYRRVNLSADGVSQDAHVHVLVAAAFIGPRIEHMTVNHIDGDKLNNRAENLEYATHAENIQHSYRTGLHGALKGKVTKTCEFCPRTFEVYPSIALLRRFCSNACRARALKPRLGTGRKVGIA